MEFQFNVARPTGKESVKDQFYHWDQNVREMDYQCYKILKKIIQDKNETTELIRVAKYAIAIREVCSINKERTNSGQTLLDWPEF